MLLVYVGIVYELSISARPAVCALRPETLVREGAPAPQRHPALKAVLFVTSSEEIPIG